MLCSTKTKVSLVAVTVLLIGLSAALFSGKASPSQALAQADPTVAAAKPATTTMPAQAQTLTVTLTITDFDNTLFIFAPSTHPELFVDCVDNPYYPLIPGTVYSYEAETEEGLETTTVTVTNEQKKVMGIVATVVHDVVRLDGVLVEDTFDWYAQDVRGHVWYLGEDVSNYEDGQFKDKAGSWEAGVDSAMPGIIMLNQPLPGDIYRQEYLAGEAEDLGGVLSVQEEVTVPYGTFDDVLITADYNPLEGGLEHKFYAPGLGLIREEAVGGDEVVALVDVMRDDDRNDNHTCGHDDDEDGDSDHTGRAPDAAAVGAQEQTKQQTYFMPFVLDRK